MKLTWYGHACFLVETSEGRAVFDPYEPGSVPGLKLPPLGAEAVLCSHEHHDHDWAAGVKLSRRRPGYRVETVPSWHDDAQGEKRGYNLIHILCCEGKRVVHLGDLGHVLTAEQVQAIGTPDVLLIPVGGTYTLDAGQAKQVCDQLQPKAIIPMHYRGNGFGLQEVAPLSAFTALFASVRTVSGSSVELTEDLEGVVVLSTPAPEALTETE